MWQRVLWIIRVTGEVTLAEVAVECLKCHFEERQYQGKAGNHPRASQFQRHTVWQERVLKKLSSHWLKRSISTFLTSFSECQKHLRGNFQITCKKSGAAKRKQFRKYFQKSVCDTQETLAGSDRILFMSNDCFVLFLCVCVKSWCTLYHIPK